MIKKLGNYMKKKFIILGMGKGKEKGKRKEKKKGGKEKVDIDVYYDINKNKYLIGEWNK